MTELRQPLLKNTLKVLKNEENKEKVNVICLNYF